MTAKKINPSQESNPWPRGRSLHLLLVDQRAVAFTKSFYGHNVEKTTFTAILSVFRLFCNWYQDFLQVLLSQVLYPSSFKALRNSVLRTFYVFFFWFYKCFLYLLVAIFFHNIFAFTQVLSPQILHVSRNNTIKQFHQLIALDEFAWFLILLEF